MVSLHRKPSRSQQTSKPASLFLKAEAGSRCPARRQFVHLSREDDDDSDLSAFLNIATQQQKTYTDISSKPDREADKQPSDPNKPTIWRYFMTLTKTEISVPDDPAIAELLTLPKRRNLPRTWQNGLRNFEEFQLITPTRSCSRTKASRTV